MRERKRDEAYTLELNITDNVRDPEDRLVAEDDESAVREKMLDKTLADSYPASDPPSSLPNPSFDSLSEVVETERVRKAA